MKQDCEISLIGSKRENGHRALDQFLESHPELKSLTVEEGRKVLFNNEILAMYPTLQMAIDNHYQEQSLRDYYMAENILSLYKKFPSDARIMVWAHNLHIAKSNYKKDDRYFTPMGAHLHNSLGSSYYALGFTALKGTFRAFLYNEGQKVFSMPDQPQDSWALFFSQFGTQNFVLDFRAFSNHHWFNQTHYLAHVGSCFSYAWGTEYCGLKQIPIEYLDGIIYLEQTSAARPMHPN